MGANGRLVNVLVEQHAANLFSVWADREAADMVRILPGVASFKISVGARNKYFFSLDPRYNAHYILSAITAMNREAPGVH